jgi:hypothetical protein
MLEVIHVEHGAIIWFNLIIVPLDEVESIIEGIVR